jgi:hypothetical protein
MSGVSTNLREGNFCSVSHSRVWVVSVCALVAMARAGLPDAGILVGPTATPAEIYAAEDLQVCMSWFSPSRLAFLDGWYVTAVTPTGMALCRGRRPGRQCLLHTSPLMTDGTCLEFCSLEAPLDEMDPYHSTGTRHTQTASPPLSSSTHGHTTSQQPAHFYCRD